MENRRLLLIADAEGCCLYRAQGYTTQEAMCLEVRTALDRLMCMPEISITVLDMHGNGHNLDSLNEQYPDIPFIHHLIGLTSYDYDGAVLLGMHAMSNMTSPSAHTFREEIQEIRLGTQPVGELELIRQWLLAYGIPLLFVSGEKALEGEVILSGLGTSCYLYPDSPEEALLLDMAGNMADRLQQSWQADKGSWRNEKISLSLRRRYYYDFFLSELFDVQGEVVQFQNLMDFFDKLFLLSQLIDAANLYAMLSAARTRYYLRECTGEEVQCEIKSEFSETLRKQRADMSVSEMESLLCAARDRAYAKPDGKT